MGGHVQNSLYDSCLEGVLTERVKSTFLLEENFALLFFNDFLMHYKKFRLKSLTYLMNFHCKFYRLVKRRKSISEARSGLTEH